MFSAYWPEQDLIRAKKYDFQELGVVLNSYYV